MTAVVQSAVPGEDDTLAITLSNGNRLDINMRPYLECAQFSALKDKSVWKNLQVRKGCLYWGEAAQTDIAALLSLLGDENGSTIAFANAQDDWRLTLRLEGGSNLSIDMEPLLEFSVFAPLVQSSLWKTLRAKEHSLLWEDDSVRLELPMNTILHYFA